MEPRSAANGSIEQTTFRELDHTAAFVRRVDEIGYPALTLAGAHYFSYGLGWFVQDYRGENMWMHTGSIDGMCAIIGLLPDKRTRVSTSSRTWTTLELRHALMYSACWISIPAEVLPVTSADVHKLFNDLLQSTELAPLRRHAFVASTSASARPLPSGTYVDSAYGTVQVTLANGTLKAAIGKDAAADLEGVGI